ncbi:MAG TPA: hypothetical protein VGA78_13965 [Gemmatimonadales bacterium]
MIDLLGVVLAGLGAFLIIGALTFVTLLIGALVTFMVILLAGPLVDKVIKEPAPAGSAKP